MSEIQNQIKKWPVTAIKKIKSTFGSAEKFYATVYLIARNEHHCQMMGVAGAEQRLKTIHAYQGMIRFMLDEEVRGSRPGPRPAASHSPASTSSRKSLWHGYAGTDIPPAAPAGTHRL